MDAPKQVFEELTAAYGARDPLVKAGKMMSSPAITWSGKVFIFLSRKNDIVFKLGKGFDPASSGCAGLVEFNPFKNKGPLRGWFACPAECGRLWLSLAEQAYDIIRE